MQDTVFLTVSEGKRLIAKAVAALPEVTQALKSGIVVVSTGSTNAYVYEEITGKQVGKRGFLTGRYSPLKLDAKTMGTNERIPDLILKNNEMITDKNKFEIIHDMGPGDVFIKGANALNYDKKVAGIAVGDPKGGTIGGIIGPVTAKKIRLVIPVGLEKLVAHDIAESWQRLNEKAERKAAVAGLFPVHGNIITEIEAIKLLFGLGAFQVGAGGVYGGEGGAALVIEGESGQIEQAKKFIRELILGEPAF